LSRPVKPRASRIALIVASVPEQVMRSNSMFGMVSQIICASSTSSAQGAPKLSPFCTTSVTAAMISGCAWPQIIGPQEPT
jgi:hypothetical protein